MYWFFLLLLITLAAGGFYLYQRLLKIEREIREEQRQAAGPAEEDSVPEGLVPDSPLEEIKENTAVQAPASEDLSESILAFVALNQGLLQAEVYSQFPKNDRRELQKCLRDLGQSGRLRREKEGSSYRLYSL